MNIAHLPTLMLVIGYPLYWVEMISATARTGITSFSAWTLWIVGLLLIVLRERRLIANHISGFGRWFKELENQMRIWVLGIAVLSALILVIALYASTYPIHLMQEGDALNYHYSLTRQHLILGTFAHIPWSGFDLFLLPVDYALAPFWFVTELPNKMPQFVFLIGLLLVVESLGRFLKGGMGYCGFLAVAFLLGSHGHGIQFGTAMLDLVNCYLFLAMIDSLLRHVRWLFIIEAAFYFWSKPFAPLQVILVLAVLCAVVIALKGMGFKNICLDFHKIIDAASLERTKLFLNKCIPGLILVSVIVAGPFVAKSLYYSGTPLFPLLPGVIPQHQIPVGSVAWSSLNGASDYWMNVTRNGYGHGRTPFDFFAHFWLVAVPSQAVNNAFDYPLGLTYLIVLGPFIILFVRSIYERRIALMPWMVVIFWLSWFMGSQQSRWLYVPLVCMFLCVAAHIVRPSRILLTVLVIALGLNAFSILRAHIRDFGKERQNVLRPKDKDLLRINESYWQERKQGFVTLDDAEVAFARFPVIIRKESLPNVIAF